ncbi:MAG TPA: AMP-binding protein [Acidimicrobiales bacterium]|nr:AMP-binding protein [Acidimicrobiales bacterium]
MTASAPAPAVLADAVTSDERRRAYAEAGLWDSSTLAGRVGEHARTRPDDIAVIDAGGRYSYRRLAADAASLAAAWAQRGIGAGAVVSIQLPNRYEAVVAAVATQSLSAVVNPLLPNYRHHELAGLFTTATPAVVVTPGTYRAFDHLPLTAGAVRAAGVEPLHVVVDGRPPAGGVELAALVAEGAGATAEPNTGRAESVSELIFTSGTEARPKAIMHTEQTANFSVRVAGEDLGIEPGDVVWMPSPVGHSTGFNYGVRFALYHGLRLVLQDVWDAAAAVDLVDTHGCSYTLAATTFLQDLVAAAERAGRKLPNLRLFGCGGAPVPPPLVDAAAGRGIGVLRLYGSTEVLVGTWNRPGSPLEKRRATDGCPMSSVEIEVRGEGGGPVGAGEPGELFVRGPNTCVGFFADPERTAATFDAEGWVRSGDLVSLDRDGYLTVVGRKKEIIIRGGMNIAPREIEGLMLEFPEVERVAVVGLPDERLGERMCACVVPVPGARLDLATVVARLRDGGLATYKLPERLEVLDALPSTASGKVQKHEIVRILTAGAGRDGSVAEAGAPGGVGGG